MDLTSHEGMTKFAEDVRQQAQPFAKAACEAFGSLFQAEYQRLRSSGLESGENAAMLNVTVFCNFDPKHRTVDVTTAPMPIALRPRRKVVNVGQR